MATKRIHNPNITWVPHLRLQWGGTLGTTKEVWSNSLNFVFDQGQTALANENIVAGMQAAAPFLASAVRGDDGFDIMCTNDVYLDYVKANWVEATGLQRAGNTNRFDYTPPVQGGRPGNVPFYQTLAITLRTPLHRGRGHSGRIFPPVTYLALDAGTSKVSAATASQLASTWANVIHRIQLAISGGANAAAHPAVLSFGNVEKGIPATFNTITGVAVDRVPDVQHRRTNRLSREEGILSLLPG